MCFHGKADVRERFCIAEEGLLGIGMLKHELVMKLLELHPCVDVIIFSKPREEHREGT